MRRVSLLLLLVGLALAGCKVDTTIEVDVDADGGGEVGVEVLLDEEAMRSVPDVDKAFAFDDLKARGWQIEAPKTSDGVTELRVSHGFDTPEQAVALVDQLDAEAGPLRDFRIEQTRSWNSVETQFAGNVDLSAGVAAWGDPVLQQRVGSALGFDPQELQNNLGIDAAATFPVTLKVDLPGHSVTYEPERTDGEWPLQYGQTHQFSASAEGWNMQPLTYFGVAILLTVVAVIVLIIWKPYRPQHAR